MRTNSSKQELEIKRICGQDGFSNKASYCAKKYQQEVGHLRSRMTFCCKVKQEATNGAIIYSYITWLIADFSNCMSRNGIWEYACHYHDPDWLDNYL